MASDVRWAVRVTKFPSHIVGIKALVGLASILSTLVRAQAVMLVLACMKLNYTRAQAVTLVLARMKLIRTCAQAVMLVLACRGLTSTRERTLNFSSHPSGAPK
jgi:hypothetical protein